MCGEVVYRAWAQKMNPNFRSASERRKSKTNNRPLAAPLTSKLARASRHAHRHARVHLHARVVMGVCALARGIAKRLACQLIFATHTSDCARRGPGQNQVAEIDSKSTLDF